MQYSKERGFPSLFQINKNIVRRVLKLLRFGISEVLDLTADNRLVQNGGEKADKEY